jgi:hypothetical protein
MKVTYTNCRCSFQERILSTSSLECPNCHLVERCCWSSTQKNLSTYYILFRILKCYSRSLIGARIGSILISFVFVFPYIGFVVNRQFAHVIASPINLTGLSPQDPINLFIFAVLFFSGIGLIVKGFI